MATKTICTLTYEPATDTAKSESKNFDILHRPSDVDKKMPVIVTNDGKIYIAKGLVDPKKVRTVTVTITVDSK